MCTGAVKFLGQLPQVTLVQPQFAGTGVNPFVPVWSHHKVQCGQRCIVLAMLLVVDTGGLGLAMCQAGFGPSSAKCM